MLTLLESIRNNEGKFPRSELQQLIDNKEKATPHLLTVIEGAVQNPEAYVKEASRIDYLYALYILAQFKENRLYPLILKLLKLPTDLLREIWDDSLTESAGRMLASVSTDDLTPIQLLVENKDFDLFARGQGLHALVTLVLQEKLSRIWAIRYFGKLLNETGPEEDPIFNAHVVSSITDLHPREAFDDICDAYDKDIGDTMMIDLDDVFNILEMPLEATLQLNKLDKQFHYIEDAIGEIEWWACFDHNEELHKAKLDKLNELQKRLEPRSGMTVKADKVGRNDSCPCGSGKKYKKCCGA